MAPSKRTRTEPLRPAEEVPPATWVRRCARRLRQLRPAKFDSDTSITFCADLWHTARELDPEKAAEQAAQAIADDEPDR